MTSDNTIMSVNADSDLREKSSLINEPADKIRK